MIFSRCPSNLFLILKLDLGAILELPACYLHFLRSTYKNRQSSQSDIRKPVTLLHHAFNYLIEIKNLVCHSKTFVFPKQSCLFDAQTHTDHIDIHLCLISPRLVINIKSGPSHFLALMFFFQDLW